MKQLVIFFLKYDSNKFNIGAVIFRNCLLEKKKCQWSSFGKSYRHYFYVYSVRFAVFVH